MRTAVQIQQGAVFSQLTVVRPSTRPKYFVCLCECGVRKEVRGDHLRTGKILSCGCFKARTARERALAGVMGDRVTHGASRTPAYTSWLAMRQRCNNKKSNAYRYYGGRGIRICERWQHFPNFLADMGQPGKGQEIDRINNDGHYEPRNCRWASRSDQQNNRRANRRIKIGGVTRTIAEWSRLSGIHHNTLTQRIDNGYPSGLLLSRKRLVGHPTKLTAKDVRAIRKSKDGGTILARRYGVSPGNITAIRQRRSWKDLPG